MAWLASLPGRLLEAVGNGGPRGMIAHDRTRLIGGLPTTASRWWGLIGNPPIPLSMKGGDYGSPLAADSHEQAVL